MKRKSISRRTYRAILTVSIVSMIAMVLTVLLVNEDLEDTMLQIEFAQERDFILMNKTGDDVLLWDTPNLAIVFVPNGKARPAVMPQIFRGLPDHYSGELELHDKTYLVNIDAVATGNLYIAKNITHFEDRESLFQLALLIMTVAIIGFSLLLALLSSRRIVTPLRRLSDHISNVPVGPAMPHIEADYVDEELYSIATTFNRFLDELESYVKREQSLLSLASHELRTPIAVMSGALDILELRDQLNESDKTTLQRVRRSCIEMQNNVEALLKLARRQAGQDVPDVFDLAPMIREIIEDLKISHLAGDRVTLTADGACEVKTDPVMARMLLRNLIQNALQHTVNDIHIAVSAGLVEIGDQGAGLTKGQQAILLGHKQFSESAAPLSGLGLYVVTLMCERLQWSLNIVQADARGTIIHLRPGTRHV